MSSFKSDCINIPAALYKSIFTNEKTDKLKLISRKPLFGLGEIIIEAGSAKLTCKDCVTGCAGLKNSFPFWYAVIIEEPIPTIRIFPFTIVETEGLELVYKIGNLELALDQNSNCWV